MFAAIFIAANITRVGNALEMFAAIFLTGPRGLGYIVAGI